MTEVVLHDEDDVLRSTEHRACRRQCGIFGGYKVAFNVLTVIYFPHFSVTNGIMQIEFVLSHSGPEGHNHKL